MRKILCFVLILLLSVSVAGCTMVSNKLQETANTKEVAKPKETAKPKQADDTADKKTVSDVVMNFGKKLQSFSLMAPAEIVSKSIKDTYSGLVSPELIAKWQSDPLNAPGRLVSSPWPDRIEIQSVVKTSDNTYQVKGKIIEITSEEVKNGGSAAEREITLTVKKIGGRWLIDAATLGEYTVVEDSIKYKNTQCGLIFNLPDSWKGYSIITDKWEGVDQNDGQKIVANGPLISIRHPLWTSQNPRQDIPIMIFTIDQWNLLQQDKFHIGAAPIGPTELGRNSKYVFALPARYNFAYLTGFEEVENIIKNKALQTTEPGM